MATGNTASVVLPLLPLPPYLQSDLQGRLHPIQDQPASEKVNDNRYQYYRRGGGLAITGTAECIAAISHGGERNDSPAALPHLAAGRLAPPSLRSPDRSGVVPVINDERSCGASPAPVLCWPPATDRMLTVTCPKCQGLMRTVDKQGVHLEQCERCRGIFLDHGELEQIYKLSSGTTTVESCRTWGHTDSPPPYRHCSDSPRPYRSGHYPDSPHPYGHHRRGRGSFLRDLFD